MSSAANYFRQRAGMRARNPYRGRHPGGIDAISAGFDPPDPLAQELIDAEAGTPTFAKPMPTAAPVIYAERPPARASAPVVNPIALAEENYIAGAPTSTGGRILQVLKNAGLGFIQGAASNPNDPLAGGIGGAAAGGLVGGFSPKTGRGLEFEMIHRPGIEAKLQREEALRQRARQAAADALKTREVESEINLRNAQATKALTPETPRAVSPYRRVEGGILNQITGELQPIAESPKTPTPAYRETFTGRVFNIADPAERAEYERIQSHGPRDKQGRFISRADERASAPKVPKGTKKTIAISDLRAWAEENNTTVDRAGAKWRADGYTITRDR